MVTRPQKASRKIFGTARSGTASPTFQHPNSTTVTIADYGKLVALLGKAFDGTVQAGEITAKGLAQLGYPEIVRIERRAGIEGVDPRLLEVLVCPVSRSALTYDRETNELISRAAGLAFPIRNGVPVMLRDEARDIGATT